MLDSIPSDFPGVTALEQLRGNLPSIDVELTGEDMEELNPMSPPT